MSSTLIVPKKTIKISILENDYEISYPLTGDFIEIEGMKSRLTRDSYNSISQGNSVASMIAKYSVDMIAFFSICCPKIKKDLKVESISELEMIDSKKLLKVYMDKVLPWLAEWEAVLNEVEVADEESDK